MFEPSGGRCEQEAEPIPVEPAHKRARIGKPDRQGPVGLENLARLNKRAAKEVVAGGAANGTIDSTTGLYTAPDAVPAGAVTVTATAQADLTKAGNATVNIKTPTAPSRCRKCFALIWAARKLFLEIPRLKRFAILRHCG